MTPSAVRGNPFTIVTAPKRVFITVAERSADTHAANFVRALRQLDPSVQIDALGGDALRAAGATVHFDTVSKAAMGLAAFKRAREVRQRLAWTRAFYEQHRPDLHVCCDSWTMNVHFARLAKSFGVKVLYYIAPQAWASREGRVRELARVADAVASILPFEERFLRDHGVNATYVGHPLFDAMTGEGVPNAEFRPPSEKAAGATRQSVFPVIALPCGSRTGVARANCSRQLAVAEKIRAVFPQATFRVPTTPATHSVVQSLVEGKPWVAAELDAFDRLIPQCDLAITVSGTATLHIAVHGVPMIVVYYGSPLLWQLIGRWLVRIRTFAMINLLANDGRDEPDKHIVPEFIPWNGPVDAVADRAIALLRDPAALQAMRDQMRAVVATIDKPGASMNVARMAMTLLRGEAESTATMRRHEGATK